MRLDYHLADVFTDRPFGGNQLAVFPDAATLSDGQMQQIAQELNLSETVFVHPPDNPAHACRLRIFTPGMELPFAGHPTVGSAFVLALLGRVELTGEITAVVFEEGVGPLNITIQSTAGRPTAAYLSAAQLPTYGASPPVDQLGPLLGLPPEAISTTPYAPPAVSCGVPFLFIPQRDRPAPGEIGFALSIWRTHFADTWAPHIFAFTHDAERPGSDLRGRMFAPAMGIPEDPATGAAATALAGWLGKQSPQQNGTLRWTLEQGFEMGRPSLIQMEADKNNGALTGIRVGGTAVIIGGGWLEV